MNDRSPRGVPQRPVPRAHSDFGGRMGDGPSSGYNIDRTSNEFPIFSRLNVDPNHYNNYSRKYYEDYDAWQKMSANRQLRSYTGSRSLPQARYQFSDPRYENFSASTDQLYMSIASRAHPPSYVSDSSFGQSATGSAPYARGNAKQKARKFLPHQAQFTRPRRIADNSYTQPSKTTKWSKKKIAMVVGGSIFSAIFVILIALTAYYGTMKQGAGPELPVPTRGALKITFAFPFGYQNRQHDPGAIKSTDVISVIRDTILANNDQSTVFAFQPYSGSAETSVVQSASFSDAFKVLDSISQRKDISNANPSLTSALKTYARTVAEDTDHKHSYVVFSPELQDYIDQPSFLGDIAESVKEMRSLAARAQVHNTRAVMLCGAPLLKQFNDGAPDAIVIQSSDNPPHNILDELVNALKTGLEPPPPPPTTPNPDVNHLKIILSFPVIQQAKTAQFQAKYVGPAYTLLTSPSDPYADRIRTITEVILGNNDGKTTFALQSYGNAQDTKLLDNLDFSMALRKLKDYVNTVGTGQNPDMTHAITKIEDAIKLDDKCTHSYVAYTPKYEDYKMNTDYDGDMASAAKEMNALAIAIKNDHTAAIALCDDHSMTIFKNEVTNVVLLDALKTEGLSDSIVYYLDPAAATPPVPTVQTESRHNKVTFAFNIAHYGQYREKRSISQKDLETIKSTLENLVDTNARITLKAYASDSTEVTVVQSVSAAEALRNLGFVHGIPGGSGNPDMTQAINKYNSEVENSPPEDRHSFIALTPKESNYATKDDFTNDMKSSGDGIAALAERMEKESAPVMVVGDSNSFGYFLNSSAGVVDSSDKTPEQIASNITMALNIPKITTTTSTTTTTTTTTTTVTPPPTIKITTPTTPFTTTTITGDPPVTTPTTAATPNTTAATPNTNATTLIPTAATPNTKPTTAKITPSTPSTPSSITPHQNITGGKCSGDFVIIADASETIENYEDRYGQYNAMIEMTARWMQAKHVGLRVSVAAMGASGDDDNLIVQPFYDNHQNLSNAVIRVAANFAGPGRIPTSVAPVLRRQYCESTSETPLDETRKTVFIIFSGWSDTPRLVQELEKTSWLNCNRGTSETVFIAGVESGSSELASLGVPSSSMYRKMLNFTTKSVKELADDIELKICGDESSGTQANKATIVKIKDTATRFATI